MSDITMIANTLVPQMQHLGGELQAMLPTLATVGVGHSILRAVAGRLSGGASSGQASIGRSVATGVILILALNFLGIGEWGKSGFATPAGFPALAALPGQTFALPGGDFDLDSLAAGRSGGIRYQPLDFSRINGGRR